jgi:hypothetical protein
MQKDALKEYCAFAVHSYPSLNGLKFRIAAFFGAIGTDDFDLVGPTYDNRLKAEAALDKLWKTVGLPVASEFVAHYFAGAEKGVIYDGIGQVRPDCPECPLNGTFNSRAEVQTALSLCKCKKMKQKAKPYKPKVADIEPTKKELPLRVFQINSPLDESAWAYVMHRTALLAAKMWIDFTDTDVSVMFDEWDVCEVAPHFLPFIAIDENGQSLADVIHKYGQEPQILAHNI